MLVLGLGLELRLVRDSVRVEIRVGVWVRCLIYYRMCKGTLEKGMS